MSTRPTAPRARHAFPRTRAAVLLLRRGGLHSTRWARRNFNVSSAWTTAVIAGVLGLGLAFLLFALAPPPEAAVEANVVPTQSDGPAAAPATSAAAAPPAELDLVIQRTYLPFGWDQNEQVTAKSMTPPLPPHSPGVVLLPWDNWQPAAVRPAIATSPVTQPYYLRAPRVDAATASAALEAADVPPGEFGPAFERNLAVAVERTPLTEGPDDTPGEYSLVVRNQGTETVERVMVRDLLPQLEQVIDVVPPAAIAPDGSLVWSLENIGPGEEVRLTVTVHSTGHPLESTASVDVASQFGTRTHVTQRDRPQPFTSEPEQPELVLPEPASLNRNVAASDAFSFEDEIPESSDAMPSPANQPGPGQSDSDLVLPDPIVPAGTIPARPAEAFEDELPAATAADNDPIPPVAATPEPTAPEPAAGVGSVPFDDVIPEPSGGEPPPNSPPAPASSTSEPFNPFDQTPSGPDPVVTTTSEVETPRADDVRASGVSRPAETPRQAQPDREEPPAWAPRTPSTNEWESPPRPALSVKTVSPGSVRMGEIVTAYYDITNTGTAPAVDVVLTVHLPAELLHKHGSTVEHRIERLEPGESRRARLLARARSTGTARLDATLSHANQNDDEVAVSIRVVGQSTGARR